MPRKQPSDPPNSMGFLTGLIKTGALQVPRSWTACLPVMLMVLNWTVVVSVYPLGFNWAADSLLREGVVRLNQMVFGLCWFLFNFFHVAAAILSFSSTASSQSQHSACPLTKDSTNRVIPLDSLAHATPVLVILLFCSNFYSVLVIKSDKAMFGGLLPIHVGTVFLYGHYVL